MSIYGSKSLNEIQFEFTNASYRGDLTQAKQLLENNPGINIYHNNNYAFRTSCSFGYVTMAKWLFSLNPNVNIYSHQHFVFREVCERGQFVWSDNYVEMAIWLASLKPYHYALELNEDKTLILNYTIRDARTVKWLERMVPILAYNSKTYNIFYNLNSDVIHEICEWV